ncbi:MAG: FkbM family methyltransferase [Thermoplasmata archaeon]|nr:FkbM family methyltransferase [Thermoplasmata archaeon]
MGDAILDTFRPEANVSISDRWLAPIHPVTVLLNRTALRNLSRYRRFYENHWRVVRARVGVGKYPLQAVLRAGGTVHIPSDRVAQLYASERLVPHPESDSVSVRFGGREWEIHRGWSTGDIHGVFVEEVYRPMPVEGKVVIDVGGSIGDSPIYFAARKARKVVALEPWPSTYKTLVENVAVNHLESVIVPMNVALGAAPGTLRLDDQFEEAQHAQIRSYSSGTEVPVVSLASLVETHGIEDGILKLDCEGGEYDALLHSPPEVIRRFSHIQAEYHYGYQNIAKALRDAGFRVRYDRPYRTVNRVLEHPVLWMGNLYADRVG